MARIGDPRDHRLDAWPGPEPLDRPAHACRRPRRASPCGPVGRARHGRGCAVPLDRRDRSLSIGRLHDPEDVAVVHRGRRPDHPQHRRPRRPTTRSRPSSATSTTCGPTTGTRSPCPTASIRQAGRPASAISSTAAISSTRSRSFDSALRSAVTNLRRTNLPVAITVDARQPCLDHHRLQGHGRSGRTTRFSVTSVRVVGPLWGLQSRTYGYDMKPDTMLTPAQLEGFFTPWHYAGDPDGLGRSMGIDPAGGEGGPACARGSETHRQTDRQADATTDSTDDAEPDGDPGREPGRSRAGDPEPFGG